MAVVGDEDLRAENWEAIVRGFALQEFRMKQVVSVQTTNAWINSFYRETATELTGGTGSAVRGVPRLAAFPYGQVTWTEVSSRIEKFGMEGVISWEDAMLDNVDVIARTLLRISRAVANAVDQRIYDQLEADAGNSVAITAGYEWDAAVVANRDPIDTILTAIEELYKDNFDPLANESFLILHPTDYANILSNSKVVNNPSFKAADVVANGRVGQLCGLKIIVFNGVTADKALVAVAKECGTWKQASPLTVMTTPDKGVKYTIRAYEMGVAQTNSPNAVVTITNTRA